MRAPSVLMTALLLLLLPLTVGALTLPASAADDASGQLLVIMDVSGSMKRTDGSGTTLISGARTAIEELVSEVPDEAEIGLRLYGSEYAGKVEAEGCIDTELAVPIGAASSTADQITRAIKGAEPTGFTPIGKALTEAAGDFDADVERSIVLVSDGEDTCGTPPPCKAAKQLSKQGIKVRVDTVGLFLQNNKKAADQLKCIASATGGTYVGADDAASLAEELTEASSRAIARYTVEGESIQGGPAMVSATEMDLETTYTDDIVKGEAKWYSFELNKGQALRLTGTDDGTVDYGCCINYSLVNTQGDRMSSDHGYSQGSANTYVVETQDFAAREDGTYYVRVTLDDKTSDTTYGELPFQFVVEAEDPVAESPSPSASATASPDATSEDDAGASDSAEDSDEGSSNTLLWVLVGVLALAVLGLGAAVLTLLRRTSARSDDV